MKIIETTLFSAFLTVSLPAAEPLYTQEGGAPRAMRDAPCQKRQTLESSLAVLSKRWKTLA